MLWYVQETEKPSPIKPKELNRLLSFTILRLKEKVDGSDIQSIKCTFLKRKIIRRKRLKGAGFGCGWAKKAILNRRDLSCDRMMKQCEREVGVIPNMKCSVNQFHYGSYLAMRLFDKGQY